MVLLTMLGIISLKNYFILVNITNHIIKGLASQMFSETQKTIPFGDVKSPSFNIFYLLILYFL
jgi:hypothetical protein